MPIEAYQRPLGFIFERLTIAILCNESLELHWQDEQSELSYLTRVFPHEIIAEDGADYLVASAGDAGEYKIRIDLIRNLPRPVK